MSSSGRQPATPSSANPQCSSFCESSSEWTSTSTTSTLSELHTKVRKHRTSVVVLDPDYQLCYRLHPSDVVHLPVESKRWNEDLVLCRRFQPGAPASCPKGNECWFVHADVRGAPSRPVHVNYAWPSLEAVSYERLPPGKELGVLAPNQRAPLEAVSSECVLVTKGSTSAAENGNGGATSHCAHYYFNRVCNRGPACQFIHRVHVDPSAKVGQRAPAPRAVPGSRGTPLGTKKVVSLQGSIGGPTSHSSNSSDEASPTRSLSAAELSFHSSAPSREGCEGSAQRLTSYQLCHTPGRTYYVELARALAEHGNSDVPSSASKYRHNPYAAAS